MRLPASGFGIQFPAWRELFLSEWNCEGGGENSGSMEEAGNEFQPD